MSRTPRRSESATTTPGRSARRGLRALLPGRRAPSSGRRLAIALAAFGLTLTLAAPAALATKFFDSIIGSTSSGTAPAQFNTPRDVAANDPTIADPSGAEGWIYVVDQSNNRIQAFDSDKDFQFTIGRDVNQTAVNDGDPQAERNICTAASGDVCQNGATGTLGGEFATAQGIDVDQQTGHFYVRERNNNRRVQEFTPTGEFVRAFGWGVDTGAAAFETCFDFETCQGAAAGSSDGQFGSSTSNSSGIAVGPDGDVYAADPASRRIMRFAVPADPTEPVAFVESIGSATEFSSFNQPVHVAVDDDGVVYGSNGADQNAVVRYRDGAFDSILVTQLTGTSSSSTSGLDVDPATGNLFVSRLNSANGVLELADPGGDPTHADSHFTNAQMGFPSNVTINGIGVDSDRLFVAVNHRVFILDSDGLGPIVISLQSPTNVQATTADLHATINPAPDGPTGEPTSFRFEVSKDGISWVQVTDDALVPPDGDTNADTPVEAEATGLEPNTVYRVRIVATRANFTGAATSSELVFVTDPAPPAVDTIAAQQVGATSAQIVGRINPGGLPTTYWFEWGDDSLSNQIPVPAASAGSGGVAQRFAERLTGLDPESVYHFRLCAENSLTPAGSPVCGADRTFITRAATEPPEGRTWEMVTDPDKPLRQGHSGTGGAHRFDYGRLQPALPSTDGTTVRWGLHPGATSGDADHGFTWAETYEFYDRGAERWEPTALTQIAPIRGGTNAVIGQAATSADLRTSAWYTQTPLFDNFPDTDTGSNQALHVLGDGGGPRGAGWYPWVDPAWYVGPVGSQNWTALIDDAGERLIGWSPQSQPAQQFHGLTPINGDAPADLDPPQTAGRALFLATPELDWRPADLINECTGAVAGDDQTRIPERVAGSPDTVGARDCEQGSPTSVDGALLRGHGRLDGSAITSMSDDGARVFFLSPDPQAGPSSCASGTGADTSCPSQLFVRQYADDGTPTVRWISRATDALFDAPQGIAALGNGVSFEGAARDGSVVYFRTNAPLTVDDPNAGEDPVSGPASPNSWDLYRYELGDDRNADPAAGDPADRLTRVSGGPGGGADPNTNCPFVATSGADAGSCASSLTPGGASPGAVNQPNGAGGVVRFMSDDGDRAYFVTAARIPGADNSSPDGGTTTPTGADDQANDATRNLYLYDANESGADAYRFVARIPFSPDSTGTGADLDSCASFAPDQRGPILGNPAAAQSLRMNAGSCVHGTSAGDAIVFQTTAQLTADDTDSAADVYLYEAGADRLTRVSAPPPGAEPYVCLRANPTAAVRQRCNGDLGFSNHLALGASSGDGFGLAGLRHWNVAEHPDGTLKALYFQSRLALDPAKVNGPGPVADTGGEGYMDVFEWRNGEVSLVSPGDSPNSAFYSGNSRDGAHVFFWTEERISAWEIDDADGDLYNATTADPFPDPPAPPPPCAVLADGCQAPPSPPAAPAAAGTETAPPQAAPEPEARDCSAFQDRARGARQRARSQRQRVKRLRQRATRQARRGNAQRAKRLRQRANRVGRRVRSNRQRAQRMRNRAQQCRQGQAGPGPQRQPGRTR